MLWRPHSGRGESEHWPRQRPTVPPFHFFRLSVCGLSPRVFWRSRLFGWQRIRWVWWWVDASWRFPECGWGVPFECGRPLRMWDWSSPRSFDEGGFCGGRRPVPRSGDVWFCPPLFCRSPWRRGWALAVVRRGRLQAPGLCKAAGPRFVRGRRPLATWTRCRFGAALGRRGFPSGCLS